MSIHKHEWLVDGGSLSEEGKRITADFQTALNDILSKTEVREMTFSEVQTLGANLHKMVGDAISDRITGRIQFANSLEQMTDAQFEAYLKVKYGSVWSRVTLTPEELARIRPLTEAHIKRAMQVDDRCTGFMWRDEYGQEAFTHNEFDYCPIHDFKNK
jgi:hypothetical protein